ncbi:redoxin domain-containing protein, partial [Acidobacteria bacterium ACD]|nr:redoxin domain-containing protein [Acidobacteria bacterium ACD]
MADDTPSSVNLAPGTPAPGFSLPGRSGNVVSLGDFAGKSDVLVYFYPKDDTPGCTKEACSLRDAWADLNAAGIAVLGISRDDAASHEAFAAKYSLPFELLTDADHAVHEAYGCWADGPVRKSFLVGKDGVVKHVFAKVETARHAEQVLEAAGFAKPAPAAAESVVEAMKSAVAEVKRAVEEVVEKPAVKKAVAAAKKAVTEAREAVEEVAEKPVVKKATAEVKKAAAGVQAEVKKAAAEVQAEVKKAVAGVQKKPA